MTTLVINRHKLDWTVGGDGNHLSAPAHERVLLTRVYGGGLDGWSADAFPDTVVCDLADPDRVSAVARWLIHTRGVDSIVALHEKDLLPAARLRGEFSLQGMTVAETIPFRDKVTMKRVLRDAGYVEVPRFLALDRFTSMSDLSWTGTGIVKSRWGLGASEIRIVNTAADIAQATRELGGDAAALEIEEYIPGTMFHCDSIVRDGSIRFTSVCEYLQPPGNFRSERYQGSVTLLDGDRRDELLRHNEQVLTALGMRDGVTHVEFIVDYRQHIHFCEAAARPGGGGISDIVKLSHGVDLIRAAVRLQEIPGAAADLQISTTKGARIHGVVGVFQNVVEKDLGDVFGAEIPGLVSYRRITQDFPGPARHATDYGHQLIVSADSRSSFDRQLRRVLEIVDDIAQDCSESTIQC